MPPPVTESLSRSSVDRLPSRWTLAKTLKEPAVEEPINRYWHRWVAFQLIRPLEHAARPVNPNHITLLSGAMGVSAGVLAYHAAEGGALFSLLAALLLFASVIFDCADGMVARLQGGGTRFGMLLDGFMDLVVGVSVWYGVSYTTVAHVGGEWAWPLAIAVLPSIVVHCAIYDQFKNRFTKGVSPPAAAKTAPDTARKVPTGLFERALEGLYRTAYGFITSAAAGDQSPTEPTVDPETYREHFALPMRLMSWMGLGTQLCVMYVATACAVLSPQIPLYVATVIITVGLNLLMVVAIVSWKRAERRVRAVALGG